MRALRWTVPAVLTSLFVCGAVSAGPSPVANMPIEEVMHLKPANAESDARDAVARGDRRLLAVYGYTIEVPGVRVDTQELKAKYGLRMLEGTSDSYQGSQDRQLNENARRYAAIYNRVVISESPK